MKQKWLQAALLAGVCGGLYWLETRRPLRRQTEAKLTRNVRNLAVASSAGLVTQFVERPLITALAGLVERRGWGLLKRRRWPGWLETALAVLLLDYTLYIWHVLTHRTPWLWRFHQVHHMDLDLDASTALRFHGGEMLISVVWRAGQVVLIGVSPRALTVWQTLLLTSILFHHSNLRLPLALEERLSRLITTPRLHGIHHSTVQAERDSNWSSGLTVWDWLHGTLRRDVPQSAIVIGVPGFETTDDVGLHNLLKLPWQSAPVLDLSTRIRPRG